MNNEKQMTLTDVSKKLPGRPSVATVWRWCRIGINGVRLEYGRLGRRIITSAEAVARFSRKLADADQAPPSQRKNQAGGASEPAGGGPCPEDQRVAKAEAQLAQLTR